MLSRVTEKIIRKNAFEQEKKTRVKFNSGLSSNRPSNNWVQENCLTTLVDICGIDFCRAALISHQNVIQCPIKIDTAPSISSFQLSY